MALSINSLRDIATETRDLLSQINNLRDSGTEDKTATLEAEALRAIQKVRQAVTDAAQAGSADKADLKEVLEEELAVIEQRIATDAILDTNEISKLLHDKAALKAQLAMVIFSGGVSWGSLLGQQDLEQFRRAIGAAAQEVRRRKKLARIVQTIFGAFRISLAIAAKIATL